MTVPLDFWHRALASLGTAEREAALDPDASASRAYYAAFYAVSAAFAKEGRTFQSHGGVESALHTDLVRTSRIPRDVGTDFSDLVRVRHRGDYGGGLRVTVEEARAAVEAARRVLDTVLVLCPDLEPPAAP